MNKKLYDTIIVLFLSLGPLSLSGCGADPDIEYEGELHFVLSGFMGEYGMREGAVINPMPTPELRVTAYLVKEGMTYRLNFSDDTEFEGDISKHTGTIHGNEHFPIHSKNKYIVKGLLYPNWDKDQKISKFLPLSKYMLESNIKTDIKITRFTLNGYGVPVDHKPVLARDLYVDHIELISEGDGSSTLNLGIKDKHVFQKNITITGTDVGKLINITGVYKKITVPDWTQTSDPEIIKIITEEHNDRTRFVFPVTK